MLKACINSFVASIDFLALEHAVLHSKMLDSETTLCNAYRLPPCAVYSIHTLLLFNSLSGPIYITSWPVGQSVHLPHKAHTS